jgi:uncharacterized membrane protein
MTVLDADVIAPNDLTDFQSRRPLPPVPRSVRNLRVHTDNTGTRMGWTVASLLLLTLGVQAWGSSYLFAGAAFAGVAMVPLALFAMVRCWTTEDGAGSWVQGSVVAGTVVYVALATVQGIINAPFYGTDAVAFGQYAAELAAKGQNPYSASMLPSLLQYHVPFIYNTHFLDGHAMAQMSYPAGNFIMYMPFALLGWTTQMAVVVDVAFWIISGVMLWRLLPNSTRFAAPIVMGAPIYLSFAIGGVNDTLYMPFLLLAVWRWDRYADSDERGPARWLGPIAIGLAMAIKQTPWFVFPFLLIGIVLEARGPDGIRWRTPIRYALIAGGVFFAINAPWIMMDPVAWYNGSIAPLTAAFIPQGQGLINLSLAAGLGGGNLGYYTLAGAAWVLLCLLAMMLRYGQMKRVWMILIIGSFFFTPRSFGNYLMMMLPAALVAAATVRPVTEMWAAPMASRFRRPASGLLIAALAGSLGAAVLAVVAPSPLAMTVQSLHTNGQKMSVLDVTVAITNRTDSTLTPHFTINSNGYPTNFWYPQGSTSGNTSTTLAPHATQTVTLHAPDTSSMPGVNSPFQVFAYTQGPNAISSTSPYVPTPTSVTLTPTAFDKPIAVGTPVQITAQLTDRIGRNVRKAGVRLSLGQVIYAEAGLLGGESSINGKPQGASPGFAVTDANGAATFTVVGKQARNDPTYFQSWITGDEHGAPSGYSSIVSVQFYGK